jgi:SET domain-containing protein
MKFYRSPKIENHKESVSGCGIFAKECISKGELVWVRDGTVVNFARAMELDQELGDYSLQIMDNCFLCPTSLTEVPDVAIFFNHPCDSTVCVFGQVCFVALRNIESAEELTVHYATIVAHEYRHQLSMWHRQMSSSDYRR